MTQTWLIIGASSAMARAFARRQATKGHSIVLAGRDVDDLTAMSNDLSARGADATEIITLDLETLAGRDEILARAQSGEGILNVALFAGAMPPQTDVEQNPDLMERVTSVNYSGPAKILLDLATVLEANGAGSVVIVGSVAGDRGRLSNYAYGSAKAGMHAFAAGLRNRLGRSGVNVLTVKPGFVDTEMTYGLDGMFLVSSPDAVAKDIDKALRKGWSVLYTPWFWMLIMTIIRLVPERIFRKLSI